VPEPRANDGPACCEGAEWSCDVVLCAAASAAPSHVCCSAPLQAEVLASAALSKGAATRLFPAMSTRRGVGCAASPPPAARGKGSRLHLAPRASAARHTVGATRRHASLSPPPALFAASSVSGHPRILLVRSRRIVTAPGRGVRHSRRSHLTRHAATGWRRASWPDKRWARASSKSQHQHRGSSADAQHTASARRRRRGPRPSPARRSCRARRQRVPVAPSALSRSSGPHA